MDVQTVALFYAQLNKHNLDTLNDIYHDEIVFEDAAHRIEGVTSLSDYFINLYQNVERCNFTIHEQHPTDNGGFLIWTMHLQHPKLRQGQLVNVRGVTHLRFQDGKVIYHRDYFDLGEMLYEQLPILGRVVRWIKRRLGQ
ncbi:nuclear transport factor 2 family protein [Vibrio gazogenes]|uniref:Ketosteroid isomerase-related protein n=1 Tax=Vibrio gazogenes DSM 21264 = NBRC 103151 TaxID=1123492 RepID=A0A1M5HRQ5_VIBGA|nr:nuclear transport factor 2 family protein [Vibrio gazogenes]USP14674.1 nuclear transport factor 2 family protein [Vibrio gazogenes]SHG18605.1 Ketosteroid isomerase-related protein [Vibrio gazogenes DSM 21264] [Vibrio gazogenes DSM 21264 = NBRC 103151]SJN55432.1 SnoaL-like domain protein [Vibrio gazogenes]